MGILRAVLILLSVVKILRQFIQLSVFIVLKNHLLFNSLIFFTIFSHFLQGIVLVVIRDIKAFAFSVFIAIR